jgi:hypothetical protein
VVLIPVSLEHLTMKARLYHLATTAMSLALLAQALGAGRKWG